MRFLVVSAVVLACWVALCQGQTDNDIDLTDRVTCNPKSATGFCSGINYTDFATPNWRNGTEEREIETELSSYVILYSSGCSNALVHLLCAYYKPPCFSTNVRLPPCRELCLYVRSTCEPTIVDYNAASSWPEHLNCDQFPPANPGCFPAFAELDMYRDLLELPAIRGAPRPPTVQKADRFWTPEEETTPPPVVTPCPDEPCTPIEPCPNGLRPGNLSGDYQEYQLAGVSRCGARCDQNMYTEVDDTVPAIVLVFSILGILATLFVIATFLIDRDRFQYPERPIVYLAVCYLIIALVFLVGSSSKLAGSSLACSPRTDPSGSFAFQHLPQSNFELLTAQSGGCVAVFVFLYFAVMASLVWWNVLTFTWFLAATLKWAEEAIGKFWILYHFLAWGIPTVQTIIAMAVQLVDGDQLSGICFIGNSSNIGLAVFVFVPLVVYLGVGMVFLTIGLVSLFHIHQQLAKDQTKSRRLSRLILRVGVFSSLYCIPNIILLLVYMFELAMKNQWQQAILCEAGPNLVGCSGVNLDSPKNGYPALVIKYIVWLVVACCISVWVISWKTVMAWKKLIWDLIPFLNQNTKNSQADIKKISSSSRI